MKARFTIATLCGIVLVFGLLFGAMSAGSSLLCSILYAFRYFLVMISILGSIATRGETRLRFLGFLVFATGYGIAGWMIFPSIDRGESTPPYAPIERMIQFSSLKIAENRFGSDYGAIIPFEPPGNRAAEAYWNSVRSARSLVSIFWGFAGSFLIIFIKRKADMLESKRDGSASSNRLREGDSRVP